MRLWTFAETRLLLTLAAALLGVAGIAWATLPPPMALSLVVVVSALGVAGMALSLRRWIVEWLVFERGQTQAMAAIHAVLPLRAPLPALTGWAVTPRVVAETLQCLGLLRLSLPEGRQPRVLECGSGASTLAVGYALQMAGGGHIVSLDHDAHYGGLTAEQARLHGLDGLVDIVHAPLTPQVVEGDTYPWYDLSALTADGPFDMLIVDGPPEATRPGARFPAFPLLESRLADEAWIMVDDTARAHEHDAVERWMAASAGRLTIHHRFDEGRGYTVCHYRR